MQSSQDSPYFLPPAIILNKISLLDKIYLGIINDKDRNQKNDCDANQYIDPLLSEDYHNWYQNYQNVTYHCNHSSQDAQLKTSLYNVIRK